MVNINCRRNTNILTISCIVFEINQRSSLFWISGIPNPPYINKIKSIKKIMKQNVIIMAGVTTCSVKANIHQKISITTTDNIFPKYIVYVWNMRRQLIQKFDLPFRFLLTHGAYTFTMRNFFTINININNNKCTIRILLVTMSMSAVYYNGKHGWDMRSNSDLHIAVADISGATMV